MQKTSTERVLSLAERVNKSKASPRILGREAAIFFEKAMELECREKYHLAAEYLEAACKDLELAYEISSEFETKVRYVVPLDIARFSQHKLAALSYRDEGNYEAVLEEIRAARDIYERIPREISAELNSELSEDIDDLEKLEQKAKTFCRVNKILKYNNPLKSLLDFAIAEERYETAARIRDRIKMEE